MTALLWRQSARGRADVAEWRTAPARAPPFRRVALVTERDTNRAPLTTTVSAVVFPPPRWPGGAVLLNRVRGLAPPVGALLGWRTAAGVTAETCTIAEVGFTE